MVLSTWNQSSVGGSPLYNLYTPNNYVSGCTATAMAQVLRFHVYPTASVGTSPFSIQVCNTATTRALRGGNGAGGPYDWANMILNPDSSVTPEQRAAIGALVADAGVAAHMNYCSGGSGASISDAATAFRTTFGYANAVCALPSGGDAAIGRSALINSSVDAGYPVIVSIYSSSSGHAIVCDGYGYNASTMYHHMNMGWGGYSDAWYNLPTVGGYSTVSYCAYNIFPASTGEIISGRITDESGAPVSGAVVTAARAAGGSYTATSNARGVYALRFVPSASTYTLSVSHPDYAFGTRQVTNATSSNYSSTTGNVWGMDFTGISGPRGSLSVIITPESLANVGAQWSIDGGAWNASGAMVSNVAARAHTIRFKGVPGWMEPQPVSVTVAANVTTARTAAYRELGTRGGSLLAMGFPVAVSGPHGEYAYAFPSPTLSTDWLNTNNASLSWSPTGGVETFYGMALARCFSLALTKSDYANVDVTVRLRLRENYANKNAAGIYVRGNPGTQNSLGVWDSGYYFCLLNNGQVLVRKFTAGSVVTELSSGFLQTTNYIPSDWNDVRVVADNSTLSFYVNGAKVFATTDTALKSGKVGIEFYDGSPYSYSGWLDVDQVTLKNF
uniref:DUF1080 domain-containing protein n=1 Tax=Fundidesulfovibrio putealis TaxID=270496 RepID=A0A7C4AGB7_9BACT